jgi:ketosteroid isomerase-like protein
MSQQSAVQARLRELYAARVSGDLAAVCACFHDEACLRFAGASGTHPISVAARGAGEFRHLLAIMLKSFTLSEFATISTLIDGQRAAAHWRAKIHSRITGTIVPTEFADLIEMREGRIASYTEFFAPC